MNTHRTQKEQDSITLNMLYKKLGHVEMHKEFLQSYLYNFNEGLKEDEPHWWRKAKAIFYIPTPKDSPILFNEMRFETDSEQSFHVYNELLDDGVMEAEMIVFVERILKRMDEMIEWLNERISEFHCVDSNPKTFK